jgi:hypothetical protein
LPVFSIGFEMLLLRKFAKGIALFIGALFGLFVLLYLEEDWRGARDWAACQKEFQAKGEILDLRQLAPPGKPEDDLSKVPIFAEIYENFAHPDNQKPARLDHISIYLGSYVSEKYPKSASYLDGHPLDLTAWQHFYRSLPQAHLPAKVGTPAQDVLCALSQFDPEMNEVETALSNSNAFWPINYKMPFAGYLGGVTSMLKVAKVIQLKAIAHLDNHESDLAEKDYLFSFEINRPLTKGCFMVNYLVSVADRTIDDSILWEGIRRHAWNTAQLQEMESAIDSTDALALAATSFRVERASGIQTMKFLKGKNPGLLAKWGDEDPGVDFFVHTSYIRPDGWWNQDILHYSLGIQNLIDAIDPAHEALDVRTFNVKRQKTIWRSLYTPLTEIALPIDYSIGEKIAKAETYRRLTCMACRLEEFYVGYQQYPEKLDELPNLPPHLSQEVLSEQPLHYQRKGDGYLLYSTSWDRKDHGGVRTGPRVEDGAKVDNADYDWVWPSP